ncbi:MULTISPECIES: T9SS type A sorting domain-containing protein [unclassified Chitinophaga]|uniref:T9SS type A sorting domain-containing protein n=1 Tax=unclassified Chitinophaga TaxID=2619133 RepID=UPI00300FBCE5
MKKLLLFAFFAALSGISVAQTLPVGTCGVVFTYDAAGNRIKREYKCAAAKMAAETSNDSSVLLQNLYPNPTAATVNINFSRPLKNGRLFIYNTNGVILFQENADYLHRTLDLSNYSDGVYLIKVVSDEQNLIRKVVKISSGGSMKY